MRVLLVLALAAVLAAAAHQPAYAAVPLMPVHGTVLAQPSPHDVIMSSRAVTGMLSAQTRAYRLDGTLALHSGEQIDAYVDRSTKPWTLRDVDPEGVYAVGQGFASVKSFLGPGDRVPDVLLVDQDGRQTRFSDFVGKTTLVTFVYTRCTDICPVVTGKFAALAQRLSPERFHLVELTIDPNYDSPAALAAYAKKYGAHEAQWSFLTGTPNSVGKLLAQFGITAIRASDSTAAVVGDAETQATDALIDHNQPLIVVGPDGRIASVIQNAAISPSDIIAVARHDAGLSSNPFKRFEVAAISLVYSLCGGYFIGETNAVAGFWILVIGLPITSYAGWRIWRAMHSEHA
ncbi:MAG TPA: SCO family protein [Candidatus Dormibacteraeota bacterium]|nr:SCO family protein [Candidatus Dormibacteraeota bacterium]